MTPRWLVTASSVIAMSVLAVSALAATAHAAPRRIAVIVGNNAGADDKTTLRFAETDAAKLAEVLGELGGVAPGDLYLLRGKPLAALRQTLSVIRAQIAHLHQDPNSRVVVLFYFSGHSDGEALELGSDRLAFPELRRSLTALGADVRVVLLDSCKSGALLAIKGGRPGPGFQIRMMNELASTGEALLTSSAADEVALESREIGGSFFTHHLISGLRGAADTSGDGMVTLTEAYQYAYSHTIKTTGETIIGTQHPAYDYRLSGQGELVLSEIGQRSAILELPGGFDRIVVIAAARDQVIAEITSDTHVRIGVSSGRYVLHAARGSGRFTTEVAVGDGTQRVVREEDLVAARVAATSSKGGAARPWSLVFSGGVRSGIARGLGAVPSLRFAAVAPAGASTALVAGSRAGTGFRETSIAAFAGYRRGVARGGWAAWAGAELGGGAVVQSQTRNTIYSGLFAAGATAGASLELAHGLALAIETTLALELLKRDGEVVAVAAPAAWLGVVVQP